MHISICVSVIRVIIVSMHCCTKLSRSTVGIIQNTPQLHLQVAKYEVKEQAANDYGAELFQLIDQINSTKSDNKMSDIVFTGWGA